MVGAGTDVVAEANRLREEHVAATAMVDDQLEAMREDVASNKYRRRQLKRRVKQDEDTVAEIAKAEADIAADEQAIAELEGERDRLDADLAEALDELRGNSEQAEEAMAQAQVCVLTGAVFDVDADGCTLPDLDKPKEMADVFTRRFSEYFRYDQNRNEWARFNLDRRVFEFIGKDGTLMPMGNFLGQWSEAKTPAYEQAMAALGKDEDAIYRGVTKYEKRAGSHTLPTQMGAFCRTEPTLWTDEWDANPYLIGLPGGLCVDFRASGKDAVRPMEPGDRITKACAVMPESGDTPLFDRFLSEITQGDQSLADYLMRWFAYSITGLTKEQVFTTLLGPGGNGKSLLCEIVEELVGGDYAHTPADGVFVQKYGGGGHNQAKAILDGMRLLTLHDPVGYFDEAFIKSFVAGGIVTADWKGGKHFSFKPVGKLTVTAQTMPKFQNLDRGVRRRLKLARMDFIPDEVDEGLKARILATEGPQILARLIKEAMLYVQDGGLVTPTCIQRWSDAMFDEGDIFAIWVDEHLQVTHGEHTPTSELYASYRAYYHNARKKAIHDTEIKQRLDNFVSENKDAYGAITYKRMSINGKRPRVFTNCQVTMPEQAGGDRAQFSSGGGDQRMSTDGKWVVN